MEYNYQVYTKPRDFILPKPHYHSKHNIIVNESNCFLSNSKKSYKYRIVSNGLHSNSSLPDIHKVSLTENNERKEIIDKLKNRIIVLTEEIKRKNGKIEEMNRLFNDIKQNNDLSAVFLIKSQEKMISTLTEQNTMLREEIKKYKEKQEIYKQKKNELLYQIDEIKSKKKKRLSSFSNCSLQSNYSLTIEGVVKEKVEEPVLMTEVKIKQMKLPLRLSSEDETQVHQYILGLYLQKSKPKKLFDYLSLNTFSFDEFIDLIYKTISKHHWKTSQDHFDMTRLIIELSNDNGGFSKQLLLNNLKDALLDEEHSEMPSFDFDIRKVNDIMETIKAHDIYKTNTIPVYMLMKIFDKEEIDDELFMYLITKIKKETMHEDEFIFSVNYSKIGVILSKKEEEEIIVHNFVNNIFKKALE